MSLPPRALLLFALALPACGGPDSLAEEAEAAHKDAEFSQAVPIFNVSDLRASQAYYRDTLGFKVNWEHGDPPDFTSVSRGDAVYFLCEGCQGTPGGWSMVFVRNVDKLHKEYKRKGAKIRLKPRDMPWGLREMHVSDLDGNVIRLATAIED